MHFQFLSQGGSLQDATLIPGFKSLPSGETREWNSGCLTVPDSFLLNQRIQVKLDPSQIGQTYFGSKYHAQSQIRTNLDCK